MYKSTLSKLALTAGLLISCFAATGCSERVAGQATANHTEDLSSFSSDDIFSYACEANQKEFAMLINAATKTITFSDISYFGQAQILKDVPFGATISSDFKSVQFDYDWYHTASYELSFTNPMYEGAAGSNQQVQLEFDDSDNARGDEAFTCTRQPAGG